MNGGWKREKIGCFTSHPFCEQLLVVCLFRASDQLMTWWVIKLTHEHDISYRSTETVNVFLDWARGLKPERFVRFDLDKFLLHKLVTIGNHSLIFIIIHVGLLASVPSTHNGNGNGMAYSPGEQQSGTSTPGDSQSSLYIMCWLFAWWLPCTMNMSTTNVLNLYTYLCSNLFLNIWIILNSYFIHDEFNLM